MQHLDDLSVSEILNLNNLPARLRSEYYDAQFDNTVCSFGLFDYLTVNACSEGVLETVDGHASCRGIMISQELIRAWQQTNKPILVVRWDAEQEHYYFWWIKGTQMWGCWPFVGHDPDAYFPG